ncbi:hypothetical protein [Pseudoalteromonas nigrifaciens]|uniref:hypothetical protein n=1 Tax=Pseudoalteromonas nigrifaciens TaxID=28109 RepID=UPI003FD4B631
MLRVEFYLDRENVEQSNIIKALAPFNERVRAEVIRHAFVAVNVFDLDISYQAALNQAGLVRGDSCNQGLFEANRYEKVVLIWRPRTIPVSLSNVLREIQDLSKRARYQYLLALFLLGNKIINGELKQHNNISSIKPNVSGVANVNEKATNTTVSHTDSVEQPSKTLQKPASNTKDVKAALGNLMKRKL